MKKTGLLTVILLSPWACAVTVPAPTGADAGDIRVAIAGGGLDGTVVVTTEERSVGCLSWDGGPGEGGGQYEITVQRIDDTVVLKGITRASDGIHSSEAVTTTIVPMNTIPWTGTLAQSTVTVSRVERNMDGAKSPK